MVDRDGPDDMQFVAIESVSPNLRCPICTGVFDDPVFSGGHPCHCTFCRACISSWFARSSKSSGKQPSCPICRRPSDMSKMVPNALVANFVSELVVCCRYQSEGCHWTGRYDSRKGHEADCLVRRCKEKDEIIAALSEKLNESERALEEFRKQSVRMAEIEAWVSKFLGSAPPSVTSLLPTEESLPSSSSMAFKDRKEKLIKVVKEGSKRGVERDSAAILGGLQFFCTSVESPEGDVEMLLECLTAMNAKADTMQEDHIGKMLFSAGTTQLAVVAYVPPAKQSQLSSEDWLQVVVNTFGGRVTTVAGDVSAGIVKPPPATDPLRVQASAIAEANNFLRRKGLLPEESDEEWR